MNPRLGAILSGDARDPAAILARAGLAPLGWLHRAGLEAYLLPYATGLRRRHQLPVPVVAIGNLVSGGTGKTPMAELVGRLLCEAGHRPALLSRGHGGARESESGVHIVSDGAGGAIADPGDVGDEPVLLARALPHVPVLVGRDRRRSGDLAVARFSPDVVFLDDALQYWQLEKDLEIHLCDTRRPFDNGALLPRGMLREPPLHLRRAGVVVLTRFDRADDGQRTAARERVAALAPHALLLTAVHAPVGWVEPSGQVVPPEALSGARVRAVAGIADGTGFVDTVRRLGADPVEIRLFADHHAYDDADIDAMARGGIDWVATTEKDWVKLAPRWPSDAPPLRALRIAMQVDRPDLLAAKLEEAIAAFGRSTTRR